MAIDAGIYGAIQTPKQVNPLEQYAQVQQIQSGQNQNRLAELMLGDKQRETEGQTALANAYKAATDPTTGAIDRNKLYGALAQGGQGAKLPAVQKGFADQDKAAVDAQKTKIESHLKELDAMGQILSGVKDQASWDAARAQAAQMFGPEKVNASMPPQYDAALVGQKRDQALSVKDQLEQKWKAMEYTTPKADAVLSSNTSIENNKRTVAASRENAAATRDVAQSNRDAARIQTGFTNEQGLRKEFEGLPEVKNYKQAYPAYAAIKDATGRNTTQSDINIVYGLAKLYDPTSVVREGEYATVANSPNIPEKVKGYAQYLAGGGRLSPETKNQILEEAKGRIGTYEAEAKKAKSSFEGIARKRGMDPSAVFADMGDMTQNPQPATPPPAASSKGWSVKEVK